MPITVGGGIRVLDDATRLIQAGAEKVSINSAAVKNPDLIDQISGKFGRCATVLGLDANRVARRQGEGKPMPTYRTWQDATGVWEEVWEIFVNGGRVGMGIDVLEWVHQAESRGAGEIVLNVMNSDGTKEGYDLEMTRRVSESVHVPVVASGGAGSPEHMLAVLKEGRADAALAASIFHFREYSVAEVKKYLAANGVLVRQV
jgi:cyclase